MTVGAVPTGQGSPKGLAIGNASDPDDIGSLHRVLLKCRLAAVSVAAAMRDIAVDGYRAEGAAWVAKSHAMALWEDALVFDPDRFSPQNMKSLDRWQYIPFGGGPRSCIGDHFAMLEATIALGTIIRTIDIHSLSDDFPLAVPFTTVAAAPIPARVRVRT